MARNDFESNYLEHHGILGQKWGKKNGPPYPLSDKEHDKVVKKAKQDAKKGNKWATSEHQPSSIRASIAAGRYAAHPTKRNEEKLRKLNDRDEARYKAAKKEYENKRVERDTERFSKEYKKKGDSTKLEQELAESALGTKAKAMLQSSIDSYKKANDEWDAETNKFWRDEKLVEKYALKAAKRENEKYPAIDKEEEEENKQYFLDAGKYESKNRKYYEEYAHQKIQDEYLNSKEGAKAKEARSKVMDAYDNFIDQSVKVTNELMGSAAGTKQFNPKSFGYKKDLGSILSYRIFNDAGLLDARESDFDEAYWEERGHVADLTFQQTKRRK